MAESQIRLLAAAARIRVLRGERLEDVLGSWPALTEEDEAEVRAVLEGEGR